MLQQSAIHLAKDIRDHKISSKEVVSFFLDRIQKWNPLINAVITINEQALAQAQQVDQKKTKTKPLEGVPVLVKDMFCTTGIKTTAGSRMLSQFTPPYSATVVEKLIDAGAIILGKCNQDEFAMGNSGETSYYQTSKNPWNVKHTAGGSSGGSAAGVATGMAPISLGTDTGGSVRQPSHFCNVVGVKPSYGRVSRYGVIAYASSLDQAGSISKKVEDSALVLSLISGEDQKDSTLSSKPVPFWHQHLTKHISDLKIGWVENQLADLLSPLTRQCLKQTKMALKDNKNTIQDMDLLLLKEAVSVYYLISSSEASSNLARYDGIRYGHQSQHSQECLTDFYCQNRGEGFGTEVKRRILMGTFCLSQGYYEAYFEKAQKVRRLIKNQIEKMFQQVDILITPTTTHPAPLIGEYKEGDIACYQADALTVFGNLAGLPCLSVPIGIFEGLPLGVQIMAPCFEEQKMLNVAYFLQETFQAYKQQPTLR